MNLQASSGEEILLTNRAAYVIPNSQESNLLSVFFFKATDFWVLWNCNALY